MPVRASLRASQIEEHVTLNDNAEVIEILREEQCSPAISTVMPYLTLTDELDQEEEMTQTEANTTPVAVAVPNNEETCCACVCEEKATVGQKIDEIEVERLLAEKERQLCEDFEKKLQKEIVLLTDRFDFILRNEQTRASFMLTEACREREEKITAMQTQLECKNLAAVMYVMCSERRRSKLDKLRIIEEYTNYINSLLNILDDGQTVILNLSRGYKTAARVDHEWRQKMNEVIAEFQNFVYHFAGGSPESNQYFFDLPKLLKTEVSVVDNPKEDPICDCEEDTINQEPLQETSWYERLDDKCRPFVMYGDMAEFAAPQRRRVLTNVKAAKTAPRKWKEYVFHEMSMQSDCPHADWIKDEYERRVPLATPTAPRCDWQPSHSPERVMDSSIQMDACSRRVTTASVDVRGMGSLLKIVCGTSRQAETKSTLLGARDSMEIASTTKLRVKSGLSMAVGAAAASLPSNKVDRLNVGMRRTSFFEESAYHNLEGDIEEPQPTETKEETSKMTQDESSTIYSELGKVHTDSMEIIVNHVPDQDHKLNYEKVCPMDKCQRLRMDSFVRSLPPYMRASPFTHFETTFENYEACTPEQLEILKSRIEERKNRAKSAAQARADASPTAEWAAGEGEGVEAQTSDVSFALPPCTCPQDPNVTPVSSRGGVFRLEELIPVKQKLDQITRQCFYDSEIDFNRFTVIGQPTAGSMNEPKSATAAKTDFTGSRLQEIKEILRKHPSLCDIFQANTR